MKKFKQTVSELTPHQKVNLRAYAARKGYKQLRTCTNFKSLTKHLQSRKLACQFFCYDYCGTLRPAAIARGDMLFARVTA